MYISGCLHVAQDIVLQITDRLERVRHVLILLDVSNDISGLGSFGEVDQLGLLDDRRDAIFDERQVSQVDTW